MFGSLCFMVNGKMCVCARADTTLCRLSAPDYLDAVERGIGRPMVMNGRTSRTFVHIGEDVLQDDAVFTEWLDKALAFNLQLTAG